MNRLSSAFLVAAAAFAMMGLSFAAKPLYDTFCRVTGFGGTTRVADARPDRVLDRVVNIRLDANVNGAPLLFRPLERVTKVRLGESTLTFYEVTNTSDQPVTAIASYNVAPHKTGPYFSKLECFCFEERVFAPGETVKLPVVFFVDPDLDNQRQLNDVQTITLSYTFFSGKEVPKTLASLDGPVSAR